jgi:tetratricopeptide (TPR) repeat protein
VEIYADTADHGAGQDERVQRASEAVEVARQSAGAAKRPEQNTRLLTALEQYLVAVHELGRLRDAMGAAREQTKVARWLVAADSAYKTTLSSALSRLADLAYRAGALTESVAACAEAATLWQELVEQNAKDGITAASRPDVVDHGYLSEQWATVLVQLAESLDATGRPEEALQAYRDAARVLRPLAANIPAHDQLLLRVLNNVAMALTQAGSHTEAMTTATEALNLARRHAATHLQAGSPQLALALWTFAEVRLAARSDLTEAMTAMDEAVVRYRGLADRNPDQFAGHLDEALAMKEQIRTRLQMPDTV